MFQAWISRNSANEPARLVIEGVSGPWRLWAGNPEIDRQLLAGRDSGAFPLSLPPERRLYFALRTRQGDKLLAEKKLPLQGAYNFRDLGGMRNRRKQELVWGKLFRGDDMMNLSGQDLNYLASIPLTSVVDFRTRREISLAPDRLPASLRYRYEYHVVPEGIANFSLEMNDTMNAGEFMGRVYRNLVLDEGLLQVYRQFFQRLEEADKLPLLFHCSAGKDRTGWAAALILFALEVDEQTIMEDYLLSAEYVKDKYPAGNQRFTVKKEYLQAGLDQARQSYGSMENFLTQGLKADITRLQAMYLG